MAQVEIIDGISWFQGKETKESHLEELNVGDWVGFKSDIEQGGKIVAMNHLAGHRYELILENEYGFKGHYIGGQTRTAVNTNEIWTD